jgi:pimeloyl-ACP methyl ester carboxylesterase
VNREQRGEREYLGLIGVSAADALAEIRAVWPDMYEAVIAGAFGGTLAAPELDRATRERATVAILAAAGDSERQLATHAAAALRLGVAPCELLALCEHVSVYADPVPSGRRPAGLCVRPPRPRPRGRLADTIHDGRDRADLSGVLDALALEQAHVVGLSYGGDVAQTAAVQRPERFASLALLATTDSPFAAFEHRARSGEVDGMEAHVAPSLTRWFTPDDLVLHGWSVRYARERVRRTDPVDWAAAWRSFAGLDVQDRLATFTRPTLVLARELDASTTPQITAALAARIPGSVYLELPGTPHMQTLSKPDLVVDALDEFLPTAHER